MHYFLFRLNASAFESQHVASSLRADQIFIEGFARLKDLLHTKVIGRFGETEDFTNASGRGESLCKCGLVLSLELGRLCCSVVVDTSFVLRAAHMVPFTVLFESVRVNCSEQGHHQKRSPEVMLD